MLIQLSRAKAAGSGMLKNANAAIVVIGVGALLYYHGWKPGKIEMVI